MKHTYTLKVLRIILEDMDFDQYNKDKGRFDELHLKNEKIENMIYPVNSLPIVQVDRQTSKPQSVRYTVPKEKGKKMPLE